MVVVRGLMWLVPNPPVFSRFLHTCKGSENVLLSCGLCVYVCVRERAREKEREGERERGRERGWGKKGCLISQQLLPDSLGCPVIFQGLAAGKRAMLSKY